MPAIPRPTTPPWRAVSGAQKLHASRAPQLTPSPCSQAWSETLETFVLAAKEEPKRQRARADASSGTGAAAPACPRGTARAPLRLGWRESRLAWPTAARQRLPWLPPARFPPRRTLGRLWVRGRGLAGPCVYRVGVSVVYVGSWFQAGVKHVLGCKAYCLAGRILPQPSPTLHDRSH